MMKKLLLTTLSMMVMSVVYAQSDRVVIYSKPFVEEHEIRVGYSPFALLIFGDGCADGYSSGHWSERGVGSLTYTYKLERWLEVGGAFTYAGAVRKKYQSVTGRSTRLTIAPHIRFSWYNSKVVRLYSSISGGIGVEIYNDKIHQEKNNTYTLFAGQLTPFGMSVGRKFFFYLEPFCVGTQGTLVIAGLGYRFPAKQQTVKY